MTRKKTVNERLSEAFRDVFDKPTDKNIREYKKYEEALLTILNTEETLCEN